jgi:hypothetical protein
MLKLENRQLSEKVINHVDIYHDDWCDFLAGRGPCNCEPDIMVNVPGKN